jgi:tetratricopeptide (TPR) repeat protein
MENDKAAAYTEWKAGTRLFPINSQGDFHNAVRHFKKAVELDDRFARAYGWLAYTYVTGHIDAWKFRNPEARLPPAQLLKDARKLADRAVKLAPRDYDTLWAKGFVRLHTGDAKVAETMFDRARALNYGNRELLTENADERVYAGHPDKAIELIMRARAIPDWQRWVLAWAYYFKARKEPVFYDLALQELQQLTEPPGQGRSPAEVHLLLAAIHGQKSRQRKNPRTKDHGDRATKHRKAYEKLRKVRKLKEIEATNPFRRNTDRKHWLAGLKAAGF